MGARDQLTPRPAASAVRTRERREYEFLENDFERVRRLIYRHAGISLSDQKQNMVYSRLARRLRTHGMGSFGQYLDRLEGDAQFGAAEYQEFVNALTTNLTSFFREPHHFPILAQHLRGLPSTRAPRIWCAAASTGEEAFSIAMTMIEATGRHSAGRVLATDIDTEVLQAAQQATYRLEAVQACGRERMRQFFLRGLGANAGLVRVRPDVVKRIDFEALNLRLEHWPRVREFAPQLDAVFCRNVLIYFDRETQRQVVGRIVQLLRPGGLLFVGHSENFTDCGASLTLLGKTVYRRK